MEAESVAARCTEQLERQGFAVLEGFIMPDELEELRMEADTLYELAEEGQHMKPRAAGATVAGASGSGIAPARRWGRDALISCIFETLPGHQCTPQLRTDSAAYRAHRTCWPLRQGVWRLLQGRLGHLVLLLLGPQAVLFNDQYIIKAPEGGPASASSSSFPWHRDSDWCRSEAVHYQPYVSVWCALDDMTVQNGCFVVQPGTHRSRQACEQANADSQQQQLQEPQQQVQHIMGQRQEQHEERWQHEMGQHAQQAQQADQQQGTVERRQQQGPAALPLEVPAGTAIITSDTVLHGSGPNRSQHMRRAWMPQFSAAPLTWRDSGRPVSLAIPLLRCRAIATVT